MPKPKTKERMKPSAKPAATRIEDHPITPRTDSRDPPAERAPALVPPGSKNLN